MEIQLNRTYCGTTASKDVIDFIERFITHNATTESEVVLKISLMLDIAIILQ